MDEKVLLKTIPSGKCFKIGTMEFIKVDDDGSHSTVLSRDCLYQSCFGRTNDFYYSDVRLSLEEKVLPLIKDLLDPHSCTSLSSLEGVLIEEVTAFCIFLEILVVEVEGFDQDRKSVV